MKWSAWFVGCAGLVVGAVAMAALVAGIAAAHPANRVGNFISSVLGIGPAQIDTRQPTVVRQIQQLERLETVVYSMEKLISGEHESAYIPKFLVGDRLLLIVHGEVVAGVDLRKITPSDVSIDAHSIHLKLPPPELFSTRVDNQRTRVYTRATGLFSSVDPQLETEVRRAGEEQIREAALRDGVLQTAAQNARATLTGLLKGFGFTQVDVSAR